MLPVDETKTNVANWNCATVCSIEWVFKNLVMPKGGFVCSFKG